MDHEANFGPVDIDCGSACETRSRSSSGTSSTDSSAATSDKSSDDKNEDEEEEEKMASVFVEAAGKKGNRWPKKRYIEEKQFKVNNFGHDMHTKVLNLILIRLCSKI